MGVAPCNLGPSGRRPNPPYDIVLVGAYQRILGPFGRRQMRPSSFQGRPTSSGAVLARAKKMPLEPRRKNGSCEIRIEKGKQKKKTHCVHVAPLGLRSPSYVKRRSPRPSAAEAAA